MIATAYVGKPAQITFTADFHELLEGDLRPGEPVTLRYDPRRIVPAGDRGQRCVQAHQRICRERGGDGKGGGGEGGGRGGDAPARKRGEGREEKGECSSCRANGRVWSLRVRKRG